MFIKIDTREYPISAGTIRVRHQDVLFPADSWMADTVLHLGYAPVLPSAPPEAGDGFTVIEAAPVQESDVWRQGWKLEPVQRTADDVLTDRMQEVMAMRDAKIVKGRAYQFPDGASGTVQLRNERDMVNVNAIATSGTMLAMAGDSTTEIAFRDAEDRTHVLSGVQAIAFGLGVMQWVSAHYAAAWAHKEALQALADGGATAAEIAAYDCSIGWPE